MQEIEIEYKNLLGQEEFDRLLTELSFPHTPQIQTNHYFETADFTLQGLGSALRIREKNDAFTLTLKEPHPDGLLETHDPLTQQEANQWLNGNKTAGKRVVKRLAEKGISSRDFIYFGSLTTKRREFHGNHVLYVLDESHYHGITDYELEIEATSEADGRQAINAILVDFNIRKRKTPNKIQRFFAALPRH
ncbi:CYTH domain-containing protein [Lentibacillus salinarum]|uniref:CYTH domain-containing protein n=1 Tax=Lentibacillus salinarum TaxID=446820 RepID=A0ABW3ZPN9_9BACI